MQKASRQLNQTINQLNENTNLQDWKLTAKVLNKQYQEGVNINHKSQKLLIFILLDKYGSKIQAEIWGLSIEKFEKIGLLKIDSNQTFQNGHICKKEQIYSMCENNQSIKFEFKKSKIQQCNQDFQNIYNLKQINKFQNNYDFGEFLFKITSHDPLIKQQTKNGNSDFKKIYVIDKNENETFITFWDDNAIQIDSKLDDLNKNCIILLICAKQKDNEQGKHISATKLTRIEINPSHIKSISNDLDQLNNIKIQKKYYDNTINVTIHHNLNSNLINHCYSDKEIKNTEFQNNRNEFIMKKHQIKSEENKMQIIKQADNFDSIRRETKKLSIKYDLKDDFKKMNNIEEQKTLAYDLKQKLKDDDEFKMNGIESQINLINFTFNLYLKLALICPNESSIMQINAASLYAVMIPLKIINNELRDQSYINTIVQQCKALKNMNDGELKNESIILIESYIQNQIEFLDMFHQNDLTQRIFKLKSLFQEIILTNHNKDLIKQIILNLLDQATIYAKINYQHNQKEGLKIIISLDQNAEYQLSNFDQDEQNKAIIDNQQQIQNELLIKKYQNLAKNEFEEDNEYFLISAKENISKAYKLICKEINNQNILTKNFQIEIDQLLYLNIYSLYIIILRYEMTNHKESLDLFKIFQQKIKKSYNEFIRLYKSIDNDNLNDFEYQIQINNIYILVTNENNKYDLKKDEEIDFQNRPDIDWLEKEIRKIKNNLNCKKVSEFLKNLIKKLPPKNGFNYEIQDKFKDMNSMKKTILQMQKSQHPDKNSQYGELWKRLTNRISQILNEILSQNKPDQNQNDTDNSDYETDDEETNQDSDSI